MRKLYENFDQNQFQNQQNSNCTDASSCLAEKAINKPISEIYLAITAITRIYPIYSPPTMDLMGKFQNLTQICLDPPKVEPSN